jgi:hypothetical protein
MGALFFDMTKIKERAPHFGSPIGGGLPTVSQPMPNFR